MPTTKARHLGRLLQWPVSEFAGRIRDQVVADRGCGCDRVRGWVEPVRVMGSARRKDFGERQTWFENSYKTIRA